MLWLPEEGQDCIDPFGESGVPGDDERLGEAAAEVAEQRFVRLGEAQEANP